MVRSPDSLIPSADGQLSDEKRDDKAIKCRQDGKANTRAATQVNAEAASSTPPTIKPIQLELFSGRACPSEAKPATTRKEANTPGRRDGVQGGSTRRKHIKKTGETLPGLAVEASREAYKSRTRKRRNEARQGVGDGHSTAGARESRCEGRVVTSIKRKKKGKAAGLPPRGKAQPRRKSQRQKPEKISKARKLQRTLYRVAKQQPQRRFTLLYDKVYRPDILEEAWKRVKTRGGAAGADKVTLEDIQTYGEERFLAEIELELKQERYRVSQVRRVQIPKPGQPGRMRPLGIPTVKDRVIQMAVKMVIEPLFEADFKPCSYGFRPKRTPRMALREIRDTLWKGNEYIVDVDLKSYFDTIDHEMLIRLVERRVGDIRILKMIRAWLKAGILEEGKVRHPDRGTPQGGVISPLLANIVLHEIDRQWYDHDKVTLVRYADDMVLLVSTEQEAQQTWERLQAQFAELKLEINWEKSHIATEREGFAFLGFEFRRKANGKRYMWPRSKACKHIRQRVREVVRSVPSNQSLGQIIKKLNPVIIGWCTYFRVGNSNRVFHKIDWATRGEIQIWLRRKYRCRWSSAKKRWNYRFLHENCRLYKMVGKVSYL